MTLSRAFAANPHTITSRTDEELESLYHDSPDDSPIGRAAYEEIQKRAEADARRYTGCETQSYGSI